MFICASRALVVLTVLLIKSIRVVECPEFRALLLLLRSDLKESMIPHRSKVRGLVIDTWKLYFQDLRRDLAVYFSVFVSLRLLISRVQDALGQVSFTTDIWSDQNRRSFLAITAHWIAKVAGTSSLQLKVAVIAFQRLQGHHDGVSLGTTILGLLDRAGVTLKVRRQRLRSMFTILTSLHPEVGHFTLDGASNNGTMLERLAISLKDRDIPFDAEDRRVMCFGHIVDLSSKQVIEKLTGAAEELEDWDSSSSQDDGSQTYEEALARNPVALARVVVRAIRGSTLRRESFDDIIRIGNEKNWFKNGEEIIKLKPQQLLRDVRTRWDSVYKMLNRLRELRPVSFYPNQFASITNIPN